MSSVGTPIVVGILLIGIASNMVYVTQTLKIQENKISNASELKQSREFDQINSDINISNVSVTPGGSILNVTILNTGKTSIKNISAIVLISDVITGYVVTNDSIISNWNYTISSYSYNRLYWDPDEILLIYIDVLSVITIGNHYLRISLPNGVTDINQWSYSG